VFPSANVSVAWFRLGAAVAAHGEDITVSTNHFNSNITHVAVTVPREGFRPSSHSAAAACSWKPRSRPPAVVTGPVSGRFTNTDGSPTTLAHRQRLRPAHGYRNRGRYGTGGGNLRHGQRNRCRPRKSVELRNQTVPANTNPDAVVMPQRMGPRRAERNISWGPNQFAPSFSLHLPVQGQCAGQCCHLPSFTSTTRPVTFTLSDKDGNPTKPGGDSPARGSRLHRGGRRLGDNKRAYNATLRATGVGNGDVYVTATTTNGLKWKSKVVIQGQQVRDPFAGRYEGRTLRR